MPRRRRIPEQPVHVPVAVEVAGLHELEGGRTADRPGRSELELEGGAAEARGEDGEELAGGVAHHEVILEVAVHRAEGRDDEPGRQRDVDILPGRSEGERGGSDGSRWRRSTRLRAEEGAELGRA